MALLIEACVTSLEQAIEAEAAGADRLELCQRLDLDGLTPEPGLLEAVRAAVSIPVMALIRPLPGPFTCSAKEVDWMARQIEELGAAGADGFTLGIINQDGRLPVMELGWLAARAAGRPLCFHKGFDQLPDPVLAARQLAELGFCRALSSGGAGLAAEHLGELDNRQQQLEDAFTLVAAGAVRAAMLDSLIAKSRLRELHTRAGAIPELCLRRNELSKA
jgi:copper homeostasis protein